MKQLPEEVWKSKCKNVCVKLGTDKMYYVYDKRFGANHTAKIADEDTAVRQAKAQARGRIVRESLEPRLLAVQAQTDGGYMIVRVEKSQSTTQPGYIVVEVLESGYFAIDGAEFAAEALAASLGGEYLGEFLPYSTTPEEAAARELAWNAHLKVGEVPL